MKLTQFLDKPVLGLYEAEEGGRISGAVFDKRLKKLKYLLVTRAGHPPVKLLPSSVAAMGPDAVLVRHLSLLTPAEAPSNCPVNAALFDSEGRSLGRVSEAVLDEQRRTLFLEAEGERFLPEQILSGGPGAVLVSRHGPARPPAPPRHSKKGRLPADRALSDDRTGEPAPQAAAENLPPFPSDKAEPNRGILPESGKAETRGSSFSESRGNGDEAERFPFFGPEDGKVLSNWAVLHSTMRPNARKTARGGEGSPSCAADYRPLTAKAEAFPTAKSPAFRPLTGDETAFPLPSRPASISKDAPSAARPDPTSESTPAATSPAMTENTPSTDRPSTTGKGFPATDHPAPAGKRTPATDYPVSASESAPTAASPAMTENTPSTDRPSTSTENTPGTTSIESAERGELRTDTDWGGVVVVRPPYTIYADFSYLLSRRAKNRVIGPDGEVLLEAGQRVTPAVLAACKRCGRLLHLAKSCALHTLGPEV